MPTVSTIIPIFIIIALGAFARRKGFIPQTFLEPANRLVYYLAIPAMIFRAIAQSSLSTDLNLMVILITLGWLPVVFLLAMALNYMMGNKGGRSGTFIQCAFHGNLGYIGLAVIFYYLGDKGLVKGSIIAGFVMILQNFLAVLALQLYGTPKVGGSGLKRFVNQILINPVILSALAGIGYAVLALPMPVVLDRSLKILSGLALPMALMLIGASLSFSLVRIQLKDALLSCSIKLIALPVLGWLTFQHFGLAAVEYLPALILLGAPPATLAYVFAKEMQGDSQLAVAAISVGTILSGMTYAILLHLAGSIS